MSNLTANEISATYGGLLNIGATGLTGSYTQVTDGFGNPLPMEVSDSAIKFTGDTFGVTNYYGAFYSTATQTNAGATSANAITYNQTDLSNGVSIASNSRITLANPGVYDIQFSAQLQKSSGGSDEVDIWLSKNGTDVAWSNTSIMLTSNPGYSVAAWNFLVQATGGDYYELYWHSSDTTATIHAAATGSNPTRPAIPSVILTVTQASA
jgi:hypothetical protein